MQDTGEVSIIIWFHDSLKNSNPKEAIKMEVSKFNHVKDHRHDTELGILIGANYMEAL